MCHSMARPSTEATVCLRDCAKAKARASETLTVVRAHGRFDPKLEELDFDNRPTSG